MSAFAGYRNMRRVHGTVGFRRFEITQTRGTKCAREIRNRLHLRQRAGADLKRRRRRPVGALDRITCGRNCQRIGPWKESLGEPGYRHHIVDHSFRFGVLTKL